MPSFKINSPRNAALDYLSRREHSKAELKAKLKSKKFDEDEIVAVLERLERENLQSDIRFAQSYIHYRVSRGVGPIKIRHELKIKGVNAELVQQAEKDENCDWMVQLETLAQRKYGDRIIINDKEKQKRCRFLLQRGFVMHDIMRLFTT